MSMNILLINPGIVDHEMVEKNIDFPLSLLTLASYLARRMPEVNIQVVDLAVEDNEDVLCKRLGSEIYDVVGITVHYRNIQKAFSIAQRAKEISANSIVMLGGIHATANHLEIINNMPFVDAVVRGEGEKVLCDVVYNLMKNKLFFAGVNSLTYRRAGFVVSSTDERLLDLAELPPIDYKYVDIERYIQSPLFNEVCWVESGRGCSGKCSFCASSSFWRNKSRYCSIDKVMSDIRTLYGRGIRRYRFTHDQFLFDRKRVFDLCNQIRESSLAIQWECYMRVDDYEEGLPSILSQAGCTKVFIGFETMSSEVQRGVGKVYDYEKVRELIKDCVENDIEVAGNFIIGLPSQSDDDIEADIARIIDMKHEGVGNIQVSMLDPYPNTAAFDEMLSTYNMRVDDSTKYSAGVAMRDQRRLYSFNAICRRSVNGVPLRTVRNVLAHLVEYYPFTISSITSVGGVKVLDIVRTMHDGNEDMLHEFKCTDMWKIMTDTLTLYTTKSSIIDDVFGYEMAIGKLSQSCIDDSIAMKCAYDVDRFIEMRDVLKYPKERTITITKKNDYIEIYS